LSDTLKIAMPTTGIPPRWILPLVLVPQPDDESLVEQIARGIGGPDTDPEAQERCIWIEVAPEKK